MFQLLQAINFAAEAHKSQKRISGGSYICHPLRVATMIDKQLYASFDDKYREDILSAAVLHDVVEDTEVTQEDLKTMFMMSPRVPFWVKELTDPEEMRGIEKHAEALIRIRKAETETQLIKLVDMLDNIMSRPDHWVKKNKGQRLRSFKARCYNLWRCIWPDDSARLPIEYFKRQLLIAITDNKYSPEKYALACLPSMQGDCTAADAIVAEYLELSSKQVKELEDTYLWLDPKEKRE